MLCKAKKNFTSPIFDVYQKILVILTQNNKQIHFFFFFSLEQTTKYFLLKEYNKKKNNLIFLYITLREKRYVYLIFNLYFLINKSFVYFREIFLIS